MTSIPPSGYDTPPEPPPAEPQPAVAPQQAAATAVAPRGHQAWPPWTAWAAIVTGFGITLFGSVIIAIAAGAFGQPVTDPSSGVKIGLMLFQNLSLVAAALIFATIAGRPRARDFGLRATALGRSIGLLLAIWFGFFAVSGIWVTALGIDERQTLPDELGAGESTLKLALVLVLVTVIAPLGEEIFFRGYFFSALRNWKGWLPAAIITGLVFGAIHIGSAPIGYTVPLALFGFGLCLLYQQTGSLYPCIALHALNNSVAFGVMQKWSWEILPVMAGSVGASLAIAWLLARALGGPAPSALAPAD